VDTALLIVAGAATFVGMEFVARAMHKYLMHGALWFLHEDHHRPTSSRFQKNDLFGLIFAAVSIALFWEWVATGDPLYAAVASGMTAYGVAYLLIHDMVIHNRHLRLRRAAYRVGFLRTLIEAHDLHHSEGRGNWGFLFVIPGVDKLPSKREVLTG
jgi:beta-carotene 3-hydroxylase